jgi:hypothetical protein
VTIRAIPNLLNEAAFFDFRSPADRAQYGAELLGRAIGHEDPHLFGGPGRVVLSGYGDILSQAGYPHHQQVRVWNAAYQALCGH